MIAQNESFEITKLEVEEQSKALLSDCALFRVRLPISLAVHLRDPGGCLSIARSIDIILL